MSETPSTIEKHISLTVQQADQLRRLSQAQQLTEEQLIRKALDILFSLTDSSDHPPDWPALSEPALQRVWDNDEDAVYDNWQELYGLSSR